MELHYTEMSGLIQNPRICAPLYVYLLNRENREVEEALYEKAAQYCVDIRHAMKTHCSCSDLMSGFTIPDEPEREKTLRRKIESAQLTVDVHGDSIYSVLELSMNEDLTPAELESFIQQIEVQYTDGIGAELELIDISSSNGDMLCIRLSHDGLCFMTGTAFEEMKNEFSEVQRFNSDDQPWSQTMK